MCTHKGVEYSHDLVAGCTLWPSLSSSVLWGGGGGGAKNESSQLILAICVFCGYKLYIPVFNYCAVLFPLMMRAV